MGGSTSVRLIAVTGCLLAAFAGSACRAETQVDEALRAFAEFAPPDTTQNATPLLAALPESTSAADYAWLVAEIDSLEVQTWAEPEDRKGRKWASWNLARGYLGRNVGEHGDAARYFGRARGSLSPAYDQNRYLRAAGLEISSLEAAGDFRTLLDVLNATTPFYPAGTRRLMDGWMARLRYGYGELTWEEEAVGIFSRLLRDLSGNTSVLYDFVTEEGDTLTLGTLPSTVFRRGDDIWTPGGQGFVFGVDDPPTLRGSRYEQIDLEGHRARVRLTSGSSIVCAEILE
jgi:hypothetical protein